MHFHFFWNLWKIQNEGEVGEKLTSMFGGEKEEKKKKKQGLTSSEFLFVRVSR